MNCTGANPGKHLFTIGHSTHPIEWFIELLAMHRVVVLADVRSFPSSRRWPQFNQAELSRSLADAHIEYCWMKQLGGRRHAVRHDSPHTAWSHPAFRSYADYTESDDFARGLRDLMELAARMRLAIMCSEGLWWRCHRRLVSDHLVIRGWSVEHIMPDGKLAEFARCDGERLIYDGGQASLKLKA